MTQYYLVYNFDKTDANDEPIIKEVDTEKLLEILSEATGNLPKIAVYKIGDCVFDWS